MSKTDLLKKDIDYIKRDIADINKHITNHIPTQINELGGKVCDIKKAFNDYKLSNKSWQIGILTTLIFLLLATLVNLVVKIGS